MVLVYIIIQSGECKFPHETLQVKITDTYYYLRLKIYIYTKITIHISSYYKTNFLTNLFRLQIHKVIHLCR